MVEVNSNRSKVTKVIGGGPQSRADGVIGGTDFTPSTPQHTPVPSGGPGLTYTPNIPYSGSRGGGNRGGKISRTEFLAREAAAKRAEEQRKKEEEARRAAEKAAQTKKASDKAEAQRLGLELQRRGQQQGFIRSTTDRFGNVVTRDIRTGNVVSYKTSGNIKTGTRSENIFEVISTGGGGSVRRTRTEVKDAGFKPVGGVGTEIIFGDEGTTFKQEVPSRTRGETKEDSVQADFKPKAEIKAYEGPYELVDPNPPKPISFDFFGLRPTLTGRTDEGFSTPTFGEEALVGKLRKPKKSKPLEDLPFTSSGISSFAAGAVGGVGLAVANFPRFVEGLIKEPKKTAVETKDYFVDLPRRLLGQDSFESGRASGELVASAAISKGIAKGAGASPVKIKASGVSYPTSAGSRTIGVVAVEAGSRGRGPVLASAELGGGIVQTVKTIKIGGPKKVNFKIDPTNRGLEPVGSPTARKVFESTEGLKGSGLSPTDAKTIRLGIEASDLVGRGTNTLIEKKLLTDLSKTMTPKEIGSLFKALKPYRSKLTIKGSSGQQSQVYQKFRREFGDIDFDVSGPESLSIKLAQIGAEAATKAEGRKFTAKGKDIVGPDGKTVQFLSKVDEASAEALGYDVAQSKGFGGFSYDLRGTQKIKIEEAGGTKFKTTTRSGQIRRKEASVFTIQGPKSRPTFGTEAGEGLSVGPPGYPKGGRTKDVADVPRLLLTEAGELQKNPLTAARGKRLEAVTKDIMKQFPETDFAKELSKGELSVPLEELSYYRAPNLRPQSPVGVPVASSPSIKASVKTSSPRSPAGLESPRSARSLSVSSVRSVSSLSAKSPVSLKSPTSLKSPASPFSLGSIGDFPSPSLKYLGSPSSPPSVGSPVSPPSPPSLKLPPIIPISPASPFSKSPRGTKRKAKSPRLLPERGFKYTATLLGLGREKRAKATKGPLFGLGKTGTKLSFTGIEARGPAGKFLTGLGSTKLLFPQFRTSGKRKKKR